MLTTTKKGNKEYLHFFQRIMFKKAYGKVFNTNGQLMTLQSVARNDRINTDQENTEAFKWNVTALCKMVKFLQHFFTSR
jgi:hypothetical protein